MRLRSPSMARARRWRSKKSSAAAAQMPYNPFEPMQILRKKSPVGIAEHNSADRMPAEIERHSENGAPAQLLPHGYRQTGQILRRPPVLAIPAESISGPFQLVPADARFGRSSRNPSLRFTGKFFGQARFVAGVQFPDKDTIDFGIAICQYRLFALKARTSSPRTRRSDSAMPLTPSPTAR